LSYLFKLLRPFGLLHSKAWRAWFRLSFTVNARCQARLLTVGEHVAFNVPVRGDGAGTVHIGSGTSFGFSLAPKVGTGEILIQARTPDAEIVIGTDNFLSNSVTICAVRSIKIGNGCQIGDFVAIYDTDFHEINAATRNLSTGIVRPVAVGDNVWIGSRSMILKGVAIGDNSVIGAMSVVTKSIPPNCVAAGNPARIIRQTA